MNKESLTLTGRVVSVNAADQSVLLESTEKSNRLRVYADNEQFKRLTHIITESRFNGVNAKELTGTQGCWIKFKMALNGITQYDIAVQAGCSPQMVSQVLGGRKNSDRVKVAIIRILGPNHFRKIHQRQIDEEEQRFMELRAAHEIYRDMCWRRVIELRAKELKKSYGPGTAVNRKPIDEDE